MTQNRRLDLDEQWKSLFSGEELFAFAGIQFQEGITGLARFAKPRRDGQKPRYVSLLLIADTPVPAQRATLENHFRSVRWDDIQHRLEGVDSIVSIPVASNPDYFILELDLYLQPRKPFTNSLVRRRLFPALAAALGFAPEELIFWTDLAEWGSLEPASSGKPPGSGTRSWLHLLLRKR